MTPLEFVEFVATGNAAKFILNQGFSALKRQAEETLNLYEEAKKNEAVAVRFVTLSQYKNEYGDLKREHSPDTREYHRKHGTGVFVF